MHTATTPTTQPMPLLQLTYTVPHAAAHLGMRAHQLFAWLRARKYLYKTNTGTHLPHPDYAAAGYFVTHHTSYQRGPVLCHSARTEITTTGLLWLAKQLNLHYKEKL